MLPSSVKSVSLFRKFRRHSIPALVYKKNQYLKNSACLSASSFLFSMRTWNMKYFVMCNRHWASVV